MDNLQLYIESLIFASSKAINQKDLKATLSAHFKTKLKDNELRQLLDELTTKYADEKYPFEIVEIAGGFQFMTKGAYYPLVSQYLRLESKKKLSKAALETLAIISYKQPVSKSGIEGIRGVNCDYTVQKLLEKELVEIGGRAEGPGRPLLYVTTEKFMNHFGLKSLNDLPKLKEFEVEENSVGPQDGELTQKSELLPEAETMNEVFDIEQDSTSSSASEEE